MSGVWEDCRRCGNPALFSGGVAPDERICEACRRVDDALRNMLRGSRKRAHPETPEETDAES